MQHAHPLNKLISWKFSEPNTRLFDDRFHFPESVGSTLFPSFLHQLRLDLAIESYFLFIIELWPPEYHGAIHAGKVPSLPPRKFSFFFLSFFLFLSRKYSTFHVEYPEYATSFGRFPSQTWILRWGWVLYIYVKYRHKFLSVDSNINQILHHSWGAGGGRWKLGECLFTRMGKVSDGLRVFLSLYRGLCYAIFSSIAVYVKRYMSLQLLHSVPITKFLQ
jgi:hypothetical protein